MSSAPRSPRWLSHLGVMAAVAAIIGLLTAGLALPFAGVIGSTAKDVAKGMDHLPAALETKPLAQKTSILDSQGNLIASVYDQNRVNVTLDQISRPMIEAIVAIEDYRFYQHGALDLKGTLRALVTNQANSGTVQGGSSITQQMVKQTLVNNAGSNAKERKKATEETYARKIRELRYAIAFEKNYSKDWILERYLNIAYFGEGAHGIQAASRHYFNKNAKKLNYKEAALLAGLVKNPVGYSPKAFPDKALNRRNTVLARMAQLQVIPQEKADALSKKKLGLKLTRVPNGCTESVAAWFCDYTLRYLAQDPSLGNTAKERMDLIRTGGLTIRTTIDLDFQKAADEAVANGVYATDNAIGGLAEVEPRSGDVKALAQSRPMGRDRKKGQTYLNYVVPQELGDSAGFQAGSTFKPFVLAAAIEKGMSMSEQIKAPDKMTFEKSNFKTCDGAPYDYGPWPVSNSTNGGGSNDMYTGTRLSVNTYYAQLEQRTGICEPFKLAKKMGIRLTNPNGDRYGNGAEYVASFVLGVANTSPLEMAEAYATFAGRGVHCEARPVTSIEDADGKVLKAYPKKCKQVLKANVADAVNAVLRGVMEPGGFGQYIGIDKPSAGKTGTIQNNAAVWFAGYTPKIATVAMVAGANYDGTPITLNYSSVGGGYIGEAFGSTVAGPIWRDAMRGIQDKLEYADFSSPSATEIAGVLTPVPSLSGLTLEEATKRVTEAGFTPEDGGRVNSSVSEGLVAYSSPGSGAQAPSGSTVYIYTSTGYVPPPPPPPKTNKGKGKNKPGKGKGKKG